MELPSYPYPVVEISDQIPLLIKVAYRFEHFAPPAAIEYRINGSRIQICDIGPELRVAHAKLVLKHDGNRLGEKSAGFGNSVHAAACTPCFRMIFKEIDEFWDVAGINDGMSVDPQNEVSSCRVNGSI